MRQLPQNIINSNKKYFELLFRLLKIPDVERRLVITTKNLPTNRKFDDGNWRLCVEDSFKFEY